MVYLHSVPEVQLGPGQIQPRGYRLTSGRYGEVRLGLLMTKGQLEVEVVTARNFACEDRENPPGDWRKMQTGITSWNLLYINYFLFL